MTMNIDDIKITIYLAKAKSETLAYVNLGFPIELEGQPAPLSISGFRIMTDHYQRHGSYRVVEPQIIRAGKKPISIFFMQNKELWFKLQSKILAEYDRLATREIYHQPDNETS